MNKGFTLIEVIVSLFLLTMFVLLMSNIVNLTASVSKVFLDYSDYEYALMHKKIFEMYDKALEVDLKRNNLEFRNEKEDMAHNIVFSNNKIYKKTKNPDKDSARGYTLLLENIKSYKLEVYNRNDNSIVKIEIEDRANKYRHLELNLKKSSKDSNSKDKNNKEIDIVNNSNNNK